ncbi:AAA family ATPase [Microvirga sp. BT688]|uniref:AAA family ATPase n=1 Tax=Microvirga sp. TaxID=1873136 RepID=UPI001683252A|nr:MoxR family ATPase [Microvirga sp.]MBD2745796.1 AAA family ATPase [Microvirga sp.]
MFEIDEQKSQIHNLVVGLYVKKTYFRLTRLRSGSFFGEPDEVADHIRGVLADKLGPQQAQTLLAAALADAQTVVRKAMEQVRFDPASDNHLEFCKALTEPAHQGEIEKLREKMKPVSDNVLAEALAQFVQHTPDVSEPLPAQEDEFEETLSHAPDPTTGQGGESSYEPLGRLHVDRDLLSTGDRLIDRATSGKFKTLVSLFDKLLEADRAAIAKPALVASNHSVSATGQYPEGHSRQVKAADLFVDALRHPTDADKLDFPVTLFEWTGRHSRVPVVDPTYRFNVDDLRHILWAMENGYNSVLTGPPGSGKTTCTREIAARLRRPWYRIPMHGEMGKRDMLGGFKQISTHQGSETRWFDGMLTQAIGQPAVIDLDEIDRADPDLQYIAHQVYEGEGITILEDEGRFVPPHRNVALMATANTKGRADALNRYQMINEMAEATRDRFQVWVDFDYQSPDDEAQILFDRGVIQTQTGADRIIKVANLIRAAYKKGEISTTCSFRQLEATARLATFDRNECEAVRRILYGRAPTMADAKTISELAHQIYGPDWNPPAPF